MWRVGSVQETRRIRFCVSRLKSAMESWDCSMNASSNGASVYEVWLQMMLQEVFSANNWTDESLFSLVGG